MTKKEEYETRRAARKANNRQTESDADLMDALDRFVTAFERIADSFESAAKSLDTLLHAQTLKAVRGDGVRYSTPSRGLGLQHDELPED